MGSQAKYPLFCQNDFQANIRISDHFVGNISLALSRYIVTNNTCTIHLDRCRSQTWIFNDHSQIILNMEYLVQHLRGLKVSVAVCLEFVNAEANMGSVDLNWMVQGADLVSLPTKCWQDGIVLDRIMQAKRYIISILTLGNNPEDLRLSFYQTDF